MEFKTSCSDSDIEELVKVVIFVNSFLKKLYLKYNMDRIFFGALVVFGTIFFMQSIEHGKAAIDSTLWQLSLIGIVLFLALRLVKTFYYYYKKNFQKMKDVEVKMIINDVGIENIALDHHHMSFTWRNIEYLVKTQNLYVFVTTSKMALFFNKKDVPNMQMLDDYIEKHLGEDKIKVLK